MRPGVRGRIRGHDRPHACHGRRQGRVEPAPEDDASQRARGRAGRAGVFPGEDSVFGATVQRARLRDRQRSATRTAIRAVVAAYRQCGAARALHDHARALDDHARDIAEQHHALIRTVQESCARDCARGIPGRNHELTNDEGS
jgi:hypothetical protein